MSTLVASADPRPEKPATSGDERTQVGTRIRRAAANTADRAALHHDENGFSLVELMVSILILTILITISTTIISAFFASGTRIQASYQGFSEILPASTNLQRYFRSMTESAPPGVTGGTYLPTPPIQYDSTNGYHLGPNSITFTSNLGDVNGPSLITIATTLNPPPTHSGPQTSTLVATVTPADPNTCPTPANNANPALTQPLTCTWNGSPRTTVDLTDLTNVSTAIAPAFQFTTKESNGAPVLYSIASGSAWEKAFGPKTCSVLTGQNVVCPADQITQVQIDLQIQPVNGFPSTFETSVSPISIAYAQNVG
jgi:prepilin-type N-terminal cleavage/methylation domain-containing protein